MLVCPVCRRALVREAARFACASGHSFDVAREGYVNLLPPGSRPGGDTAEMLRARRAFLERGFYEPLADALAARARGRILDAGCGEGWYLRRLRGERVGIDLAKAAVRLAARRDPDATYAVASVHELPLADASVDTALSVFAHRSWPELARVLRPGGLLLLAEPGAGHLRELRELLADDPRMRRETTPRVEAEGPLRPVETERLRFRLALGRDDLRSLLTMTPFVLHASPERRAAVEARDGLDVGVDVALRVLQKGESPLLAADGLSAVAGDEGGEPASPWCPERR